VFQCNRACRRGAASCDLSAQLSFTSTTHDIVILSLTIYSSPPFTASDIHPSRNIFPDSNTASPRGWRGAVVGSMRILQRGDILRAGFPTPRIYAARPGHLAVHNGRAQSLESISAFVQASSDIRRLVKTITFSRVAREVQGVWRRPCIRPWRSPGESRRCLEKSLLIGFVLIYLADVQ
jgi:hypothetical protein